MQPTKRLEKHSVQEFEDKNSIGYSTLWTWDYNAQPGTILPEWGLHSRDRVLRDLYRNHYNWIGQAAVAALIRKVKQVPYTIQAGRNNATYYQEIFNQAQFNRGWGEFLSRFLLDFLTCDYGGYWEIIGRGKADSPIRGRIMGLSALDSLRCVPTGNNEYPVIYYSKITGQMHRLHTSRVIRIVDMPDGDESRHLAGLSAMSRAAAMIEQQIPLQQYVAGSMDDKPPIGIFYNNAGMNDDQWNDAVINWKQQRDRGQTGIITIQGQSDKQNTGQFLRFANAPEGFDYNVYTEIAVNAFAAAFGIDRQDIWPLTGKMAGTATQSEIMFEKSRGMAFGDILTTIERTLNNLVLPKGVEFEFEYEDDEKDKAIADRDAVILANAQSLNSLGVPTEQVLRYLAHNSDQFEDILTDENGEIIELSDDDNDDETENEAPDFLEPQQQQVPQGSNPAIQADDNTANIEEDANQQQDKAYKQGAKWPAFSYIPLANHPSIVRAVRDLKMIFGEDDRIEWQTAPTYHITLAYAEYMTEGSIERLDGFIHAEKLELSPVQGDAIGYFDTPDGKAVYINVQHTSLLDATQSNIYSAFEKYGQGLSDYSKPQNWNPHITLAYVPNDIPIDVTSLNSIFSYLDDVVFTPDSVIVGRDDYEPSLIVTASQHIKAYKSLDSTRAEFMTRFNATLKDLRAGNLNRRRAGIIIRGMLNTYGNRAFNDGLDAGGVDISERNSDDENTVMRILTEQSPYVSKFTDEIVNGSGITDEQARQKATMWFNKSIDPFYQAGKLSADANGMYEWRLGPTEHCSDCRQLSGQRHRLKVFMDTGWHPRSSNLECGGFHCQCQLVKTRKSASGRLPHSANPRG